MKSIFRFLSIILICCLVGDLCIHLLDVSFHKTVELIESSSESEFESEIDDDCKIVEVSFLNVENINFHFSTEFVKPLLLVHHLNITTPPPEFS